MKALPYVVALAFIVLATLLALSSDTFNVAGQFGAIILYGIAALAATCKIK